VPKRRFDPGVKVGIGMDTAKAADRLRSLASDSTKRSTTALLQDVFLDIEAALRAGVSQVTILDELRALGLEVNSNTFRTTLRRLRMKQPRAVAERRFGRSDFALTAFPEVCAAGSTTANGALYDAEALARLLRASAGARAGVKDGSRPSWPIAMAGARPAV
jgi:hypothetical protein